MMETRSRLHADLAPLLNLLFFGAALFAMDRVLREYHYRDIVRAVHSLPVMDLLAAVVLTALGYLALVGCDAVAFRFIGFKLEFRRIVVPSFITFAVSNNAPAALLAAGGVRFRLYERYGLSASDAAVVAGFNAVTYAVGLCFVAGICLAVQPSAGGGVVPLSVPGRITGVLLLCVAIGYVAIARFRGGQVRLWRWALQLPGGRIAAAQLGVSTADWLLSSGALYVLLSAVAHLSWLSFATTFFIAQAAALLLPVPGGIGVFEAVMLLLRPAGASAPAALAALLAYRVIYYLLPLLVAGLLLAHGAAERLRATEHPAREILARFSAFAPHALAAITFLAGILLLVTGAIPTSERRVAWLAEVLPPAVIEASHFMGSIVGALLVVVAWGIERRARPAYQATLGLFGAGIALAMLRSFDVPTGLFLLLALGLLLAADSEFPRSASLLREPIGRVWLFVLGVTFCVNVWVASIVLRDARLAGETWWRFTLFGEAPRVFRATAGAAVVMLVFAVARLFARAAPASRPGSAGQGMARKEEALRKLGREQKHERDREQSE